MQYWREWSALPHTDEMHQSQINQLTYSDKLVDSNNIGDIGCKYLRSA